MAKVQGENPKPGLSKGKKTGLAAAAFLAVIALAAVGFKLSAPERLSNYAKGTLATMKTPGHAGQVPPVQFMDADGKLMTIDDLKGRVVVMNLWATWCGPCKVEMPTLGKLQAHYPDKSALLVAAVSVDKNDDLNLAKAEIAANAPLTLFRDPGYKLAFSLKPRAEGFPTTLIIDRQGRERARMSGPADWNAPEVKALLDRLLRES
jgi:thiol-disulfide isomerase/thioredoxin